MEYSMAVMFTTSRESVIRPRSELMTSPQNPPSSPTLRGERVDLRAVEADDLPHIHRWRNDPETSGDYDIFRPATFDEVRRRFTEERALTAEGGTLVITRKDGTPVGLLTCHRVSYGMNSPAFNIGIEIEPAQRGNRFGGEAQRLFADYLLCVYPVGRIEASTDIDNIAEQRSLERAGFQREGVARSASWRGGSWHDMVLYGRIRSDS
jgi:RimJ/RimL family protein N-acetyltransferase